MEKDNYEKILDQIEHFNRIDSHSNTKRVCMEALRYNPNDQWVLSMLTRAYYELREFKECTQTGLDALQHQTPYQQAFIFNILAAERNFAQDYKKAVEYSKKAVEGRPENANFLAQYAENLGNIKRMEEAKAMFSRAEEMEPGNYFVLSAQFQFYHDFFRDRKKEEELLSRMLTVSTKPFDLNWKLGIFHLKYNEKQEAYNYFVQAILIKPGDDICREALNNLERQGYGSGKRRLKPWLQSIIAVVVVLVFIIGGIVLYEYLAAWVF